MGLMVFSDAWARAWCAGLNESETYREAAATWEGSVALIVAAGAEASSGGVFVDLARGACRAARTATPGDLDTATFVIAGAAPVWRGLLEGRTELLAALLRGQLRIVRGNLGTLLRYLAAARHMIEAATRLETDFPQDWLGGP